MKTEFELELGAGDEKAGHSMQIKIIGKKPDNLPYVAVYGKTSPGATQVSGWIADKDMEQFGVNILKAIKSKKLKR